MVIEVLVIVCIFLGIGVQVYYFMCRREETREDEMLLLD